MAAMKIKPEHVEQIRDAIAPYNQPWLREEYQKAGLSDKRFRWDCIHKTLGSRWICDNIYPYANDDHLDTVLRKLTGTK